MNVRKILSLSFCVLALSSHDSPAQFQANLNPSKDNTLYEDLTGSLSNGAGAQFFAGKTGANAQQKLRRGLIAFDIAGNIPASSVIDSVKLKLTMSQTVSGPQTIQLHRVLADWGEGTSEALGNGAPATLGDATWTFRFFNTLSWTKDGGDFATAASASQTVGGIGVYFWNSTPQMVADVQAWLNAPESNFGWLVRGNESSSQTAKRFDSRDHITPANRPLLTVFYRRTVRVDEKKPNLPATFSLAQNYPNPLQASAFNPSTTIQFFLPASARVRLQILDISGREIERLADGLFSAGEHRAQWNAEKQSGGIYLYRLQVGNFSATRKLIVVR